MMGFELKGLAELLERVEVPVHVNTHEADWVSRVTGIAPSELTLLFRLAGLGVTHVGGGTAGDWGIRPLKLDEVRYTGRVLAPAEMLRVATPDATGLRTMGRGTLSRTLVLRTTA